MGAAVALKRKRGGDPLGDSLSAICGGALALNLLLVLGLLTLISVMGMPYFWQRKLVEIHLEDGTRLLGEIHDREELPRAEGAAASAGTRLQMKLGNRDLTGEDFRWIEESRIAGRSLPPDAVVLERLEYGNFYGRMVGLKRGGVLLAGDPEEVWRLFGPLHDVKMEQLRRIRDLEKIEIGGINGRIEKLRLALRGIDREP